MWVGSRDLIFHGQINPNIKTDSNPWTWPDQSDGIMTWQITLTCNIFFSLKSHLYCKRTEFILTFWNRKLSFFFFAHLRRTVFWNRIPFSFCNINNRMWDSCMERKSIFFLSFLNPCAFFLSCTLFISYWMYCLDFFGFFRSIWFGLVVYLEAFVALLLYYQSFTISFESQCYTLDSNIHF